MHIRRPAAEFSNPEVSLLRITKMTESLKTLNAVRQAVADQLAVGIVLGLEIGGGHDDSVRRRVNLTIQVKGVPPPRSWRRNRFRR